MRIVTGVYSTAKIFTDSVEDYAVAQIQMICDNEAARDSQICIMPDVHPGKVGPVGLSMTVGKQILPNLIGVDIGCGMSMVHIKDKRIEYGAAYIAYPEILQEVAEKMHADFYMIPSSVHELLICPVDEQLNVSEYLGLIKRTNVEMLRPEDVLSDSLYLYRRNEQKVYCIAE